VPICPTCREFYQGDESFCPRDGTALQASHADPLIGQVLGGRYLIEVRVGEGGMGTVYRARQQSLDRAVAVKLLRRDLVGDDAAMVRFQREARAASALDHPNCIKVLDFGQTSDGLLYLVMELLTGESLGQVLLRGPLPVLRALGIMRHVALALGHAHDHAIIHRDLKPDNVYLCAGDVVKVLDFGLCKRVSDVEAGVTQAGVVFGTPEYMSPEQAEAKPLDARSDLYSLGAVLFRAVTGDLPFHASTYMGLLTQHISALPPVPSSVRPELGIPPGVDELVLRLLEKDPASRPASARIVAQEIERVMVELEAARTGETAAVIAASPFGSGRVQAVPAAVASGPFGSGRVQAVPVAVASGGLRSAPLAAASGPVAAAASGPVAAASQAGATPSTSTPTVPRAPRAPVVLALLILVVGGAGIGVWQAGWLQGRRPAAAAATLDAAPAGPASAPAPTGVAASSGAPTFAGPAVVAAPAHPAPTGTRAPAPAAKAAPAVASTGPKKPPRETTIARAPQRDAGVPRVVPPPPPPPPPVRVIPPPPQQDAGVAPGRTPGDDQATVALLKARVALLRGDLEGALRELEAARRLRENAAVHVGFAEVYTRQGNTLRALAHWQKAVNLSPRDATLRVRFAEALARAGEVEEACSAVRAALALRPQHVRGLALQGRLNCVER
jgi:serine/threonine-protein kinase